MGNANACSGMGDVVMDIMDMDIVWMMGTIEVDGGCCGFGGRHKDSTKISTWQWFGGRHNDSIRDWRET